MTDNAHVDTARELVALPFFRWMPGMRDLEGDRVWDLTDDGQPMWGGSDAIGPSGTLPDVRDPGTRGCIQQMVDERCDKFSHSKQEVDGTWVCWTPGIGFTGPTREAAQIKALAYTARHAHPSEVKS